jgi:hypothetical protein
MRAARSTVPRRGCQREIWMKNQRVRRNRVIAACPAQFVGNAQGQRVATRALGARAARPRLPIPRRKCGRDACAPGLAPTFSSLKVVDCSLILKGGRPWSTASQPDLLFIPLKPRVCRSLRDPHQLEPNGPNAKTLCVRVWARNEREARDAVKRCRKSRRKHSRKSHEHWQASLTCFAVASGGCE